MNLLKTTIKVTLLAILLFVGIVALFVYISPNLLYKIRENFAQNKEQIFIPLISPKIAVGLPARLIIPEIGQIHL